MIKFVIMCRVETCFQTCNCYRVEYCMLKDCIPDSQYSKTLILNVYESPVDLYVVVKKGHLNLHGKFIYSRNSLTSALLFKSNKK